MTTKEIKQLNIFLSKRNFDNMTYRELDKLNKLLQDYKFDVQYEYVEQGNEYYEFYYYDNKFYVHHFFNGLEDFKRIKYNDLYKYNNFEEILYYFNKKYPAYTRKLKLKEILKK